MAITFFSGALGVGIAGSALSKAMNWGIVSLKTKTEGMPNDWIKTAAKVALFTLALVSLMVFFLAGVGGVFVAFSSLIIATGLPLEIAALALIIMGVVFREEFFAVSAILCEWAGVFDSLGVV